MPLGLPLLGSHDTNKEHEHFASHNLVDLQSYSIPQNSDPSNTDLFASSQFFYQMSIPQQAHLAILKITIIISYATYLFGNGLSTGKQ